MYDQGIKDALRRLGMLRLTRQQRKTYAGMIKRMPPDERRALIKKLEQEYTS